MRKAITLLFLMLLSSPCFAVDLTKIERSIRKEPAYRDKPKYCLLVFGPEATTRVWLVLDGKRLFVDRNGNGDLTDDGEPISAKKGLELHGPDTEFYFEAGDITDGLRTHNNLNLFITKYEADGRSDKIKKWLAQTPGDRGYALWLDVDWHGFRENGKRTRQIAGPWDDAGILFFADKPREAPIIHLGGPLRIVCEEKGRLIVGREKDLMVSITTPGLGAGTTASLYYTAIPESAPPRVEITFPPEKLGEQPLKRHYELKERC